MEVDAAFGRRGRSVEFGKIFVTGEGIGIENDLMKIGRFVKLADGLECVRVLWIEGEGVGEMDF